MQSMNESMQSMNESRLFEKKHWFRLLASTCKSYLVTSRKNYHNPRFVASVDFRVKLTVAIKF